jgi:hypothetical protein
VLIKDYFERCYIINLPNRTDRYRAMVRELNKVGMPPTPGRVEFVPGIRPGEAPPGWPNIGAYGGLLAHLAVLKRARQQGLANVLVMEDDLHFDDSFPAIQEWLAERLQDNDWGFVYFGHQLSLKADSLTLHPWSKDVPLAHFYGIHGQIFDRLIDYLEQTQLRPPGHPLGARTFIDGAYSMFRAQNQDILTLVAAPSLGGQRSSRSDITTAWFDRVPGLMQLASLARAAKQWLPLPRSPSQAPAASTTPPKTP